MNVVDFQKAFVLEFVLELSNERSCIAKKSRSAPVDTVSLAQPLCLTIITPNLFPRATRAIAESPAFTCGAVVTTLSSGLTSETARKQRANFRFAIRTIDRSVIFRRHAKRSRSSDTSGARIN